MNQLDKKSYTVFLNSNDKVSGSNNNATYQINWDDFLPRDVDFYKVVFSFQTAGGYYKDNSATLKISAISGSTGSGFQCAVDPIYNSSTGYTSIIISVIVGIIFAGNYATINGVNYLIIQTAFLIGDTVIIQGQPTIALNTGYSGGSYATLTSNTKDAYTGSLSIGQNLLYNNSSFTILNITGMNTNTTTLTVSGAPTNNYLPFNVPLYASNGTNYNGCKIILNNLGRSFSFDTSSRSSSLTLGNAFRDAQTAISNSNCLSTFYMQNTPKTIARPNQNMINIQIYNNSNVFKNGLLLQNQLLVNTDYFSTPLDDMTPYSIILEFIPLGK